MSPLHPPPLNLLDKFHGTEPLPLYTARVCVEGGESGHGRASGRVRSDDGALVADLRLPVELGGPGGGTNPEQLLAAGYASCFHGVLVLFASNSGIALTDLSIDAAVTFARDPVDGLFQLSANVVVHMPGMDPRQAAALVRQAERTCPYTKMFRLGISHSIVVA
ncbi:peroxiredoxin, Ohr subfamily [Pseudoxanthomonas sp. GM95]|uniref:Ohr family peroxiredoxin n=1 Tax=Pseudoxanthomonas sp. GM95 TaxID=1881043 RepID=UPI0008D899E9|nr:Ohr family peroxiredoxin [Pseudoxanthomonas sp. GM95]SEL12260.1 peroxiredoxin, Ohr subfamily [Pseudoxanthomonas sp. GM95]